MEFLSELKGLDIIFQLFIKSTLILTLSLALVFLFRKKSATLRHFILSLALISLLLLPFFSSIPKGWETRLLPSLNSTTPNPFHTEKAQLDIALPFRINTLGTVADLEPPRALDLKTTGILLPSRNKTSNTNGWIGPLLLALWTAGLVVLLIRILLGLYGAHRLTRHGKRISNPTWRELLVLFLRAISIKRKISLLSHRRVKTPLTWGVIKPVVIFPDESENWSDDQRSSALFHELSHIKRGDFLIKILACISCALYWFNPLGWFAFQWMKKEQEKACDELVLKAGVKPSTYAANLLSIKKAGHIHWNPPTAALGAVGKSQLNERLIAILKQQFSPKEVRMKTKILLSTLVIVSIAFIGLARPSQSAAYSKNSILKEDVVLTDTQVQQGEVVILEKQDQQEKQKAEKAEKIESQEKKEKKTVIWTDKDGQKFEIIITSGEGEEAETVTVVGHPDIQIDKDEDKKTVTILLPEKVLTLLYDDQGNWTIEADRLNLHYELAKPIKLQHGLFHTLHIDKDESGKKYVVLAKPNFAIKKHDLADVYISLPESKLNVLPYISVQTAPYITTFTNGHVYGVAQEKLEEKLEKIREKLQKIREEKTLTEEARAEALKEVEESLKQLSDKLKEKSEKLKDIKLSVAYDLKDKHIDTPIILKAGKHINLAIKDHIKNSISVVKKDDEGQFQIMFQASLTEENKQKYEKMVEKLKAKLPDTYTVELEIDEEGETVAVTIKGIDDDQDNIKEKIEKIIEDIKAELKEIKDVITV